MVKSKIQRIESKGYRADVQVFRLDSPESFTNNYLLKFAQCNGYYCPGQSVMRANKDGSIVHLGRANKKTIFLDF